MKNALEANYGRIYTSDCVIDEAVTTAFVRTRRHDLAVDIGRYIIESPRITKLWTTREAFDIAWMKFLALKDRTLSFTDCVSIAHMEKNKIGQITSFDSDGLIQRID